MPISRTFSPGSKILINTQVVKALGRKVPGCRQSALSPPGTFVCAPGRPGPKGKASGVLHRDCEFLKGQGGLVSPLTCLLCVTDVTLDNGAVQLWHGSCTSKLLPKNPSRVVTGLKHTTIQGKAGTVFIFSAAMLHKSMANVTDQDRLTLQWYLIPPSAPPIVQADYNQFLSVTKNNEAYNVYINLQRCKDRRAHMHGGPTIKV